MTDFEKELRENEKKRVETEYQKAVEDRVHELEQKSSISIDRLRTATQETIKQADEAMNRKFDKDWTRGKIVAGIILVISVVIAIATMNVGFVLAGIIAAVIGFFWAAASSSIKEEADMQTDAKQNLLDESARIREKCAEDVAAVRNGTDPQIIAVKNKLTAESEKRIQAALEERESKEKAAMDAETERLNAHNKAVQAFRERVMISDISFDPITDSAMAFFDALYRNVREDKTSELLEIRMDAEVRADRIVYTSPGKTGQKEFVFKEHMLQDLNESVQREGFALVLKDELDAKLQEKYEAEDFRKRWMMDASWMKLQIQFINPALADDQMQSWV